MKHTYKITGMTCSGCSDHVKKTLEAVSGVSHALVEFDKQEAVISMQEHVPIVTFKEALKDNGGQYDIHLMNDDIELHHSLSNIKQSKAQGQGMYYCPMLCEGDRQYNQPGDCPKCVMHLVKEKKASSASVT